MLTQWQSLPLYLSRSLSLSLSLHEASSITMAIALVRSLTGCALCARKATLRDSLLSGACCNGRAKGGGGWGAFVFPSTPPVSVSRYQISVFVIFSIFSAMQWMMIRGLVSNYSGFSNTLALILWILLRKPTELKGILLSLFCFLLSLATYIFYLILQHANDD